MVERQEIDALLIGALYGELTPAEEARLTAHLESHPGDRTALDDLKSARAKVRAKIDESRLFELQLDPPQAISALLVQEAARRAPRKAPEERTEGWFARFVRSFVAHPAMAAAATLVLVVGVAGTLYLKNGKDQFAEQTVSSYEAAKPPEPTPPAAADDRAAERARTVATGGAVGQGSGEYRVALAPETRNTNAVPVADPYKGNRQGGDLLESPRPPAKAPMGHVETQNARLDGKPEAKKAKYVEIAKQEQAPRDLDDAEGAAATNAPSAGMVAGGRGAGPGGAGGGAAPSRSPAPTTQPAAPPPPPPQAAPSQATVAKTIDGNAKLAQDQQLLGWAKDQHARVTALVKANNCRDAAPLAIDIKNRAPDYYAANMANDRALSKCIVYVNDAADKDAEKNAKSRAQKRAAPLDEAAH